MRAEWEAWEGEEGEVWGSKKEAGTSTCITTARPASSSAMTKLLWKRAQQQANIRSPKESPGLTPSEWAW